MPMLSFGLVLVSAVASFAEGASVCPVLSKKNYGNDHCEVLSFVPREEGSDIMIGTVWVNTGDCIAKFLNVSIQELATVWPEAVIIKKNGPRMFMTSCSGFDSMAAAQARRSMPVRNMPQRSLLGTAYAAQAQLTMTRAAAEKWSGGNGGDGGFGKGSLVNRSVVFAWEAGLRVYELIDPNGWPYIMQSMSMQVDNDLKVESLETLGDRLSEMPEGWRYRSRVLEVGIAVRGRDGMIAQVVQDQYENSYSRYDTHNGVPWWDAEFDTDSDNGSGITSTATILHSSLVVGIVASLVCNVFK